MRGTHAWITAAALLVALPARAVEPSAVCRQLAALMEARDFLGAQKLAESVRGQDRHVLQARALATALGADYSFLAQFRGQYSDDDGPCPPADRQHLEEALAARAERAHDLLRDARDLPPWDREAGDLILTWAAAGSYPDRRVRDELEDGASAHLRRYPETPYRRFFLSTLVHRYHPPSAGFEIEGFGAVFAYPGKTRHQLEAHPGGGGGLSYSEGSFRLGLQLIGSAATLRQPLADRTEWTAGRRATWFVAEATAGYRPTWGRQGALALLGFGYAHLGLERHDGTDRLSYFHASVSLGYDLAFRAQGAPRTLGRDEPWHQLGVLVRGEVVAFGTAGESGGISLAPAGVMLRLGVVAEDRFRERVVE
jgi:hypothetical protein